MPKRWKTFQRLDSFDYANDSRNVQKKTTTNKHKHTNYTVYVLPNKTNELNIRCVQCVHPVLFALQCTHSGSVFLVEKHSMHFYVLAICVISFGHGLCAIRCRSSSLAAAFFLLLFRYSNVMSVTAIRVREYNSCGKRDSLCALRLRLCPHKPVHSHAIQRTLFYSLHSDCLCCSFCISLLLIVYYTHEHLLHLLFVNKNG